MNPRPLHSSYVQGPGLIPTPRERPQHMPAAYTTLDAANQRIDQLEAELAATAEAARQAHKSADKARAEVMELKMTAQADPAMYRATPDRGTYANPAGGL